MSLSEIVDVTITRETATVTQQGFGTGLILAAHAFWPERVRYYATLSALVADGFASTSEVYKAAAKVFAQSPAPKRLAVGRRQVDEIDITITVQNSTAYVVTINGTAYTYTSDASATEQEIVDGLIAAIAASPVTGSDGGANTLTITADTLGVGFGVAVSSNMTIGTATAVNTIAEDLAAIQLEQGDWYGFVLTDRSSASQQAAALWAEASGKVFFAASEEANVADQTAAADSTTLAHILSAADYERSFGVYHDDADAAYPDAAAMGWALAHDPGTYTMALKSLASVAVVSLTETQSTNVRAKNFNSYELVGGQNILREGVVASGEFLDTIIGIDWLQARITERVFARLVSALKIPFTDAGVAVIEGEVRAQLKEGVDRGFLSSFTVTVPLVKDVSNVNRAARTLPDVKFTAVLAGAIHKTVITGVVTV